jgi:hypothetical protein
MKVRRHNLIAASHFRSLIRIEEGRYCLRPLEHRDRRFESCLGHGCVSACFCVVLSCVGRGLASG